MSRCVAFGIFDDPEVDAPSLRAQRLRIVSGRGRSTKGYAQGFSFGNSNNLRRRWRSKWFARRTCDVCLTKRFGWEMAPDGRCGRCAGWPMSERKKHE